MKEEFDGDLKKVGISEERQALMQELLTRYCRFIGGWSKDDLKMVVGTEDAIVITDCFKKRSDLLI